MTIERIEDAEPIEPLDELDGLSAEIGSLPRRSDALEYASVKQAVASFERTPLPIAILDISLNFAFTNGAFETLRRTFSYPNSSSFVETFARTLSGDSVKAIHESLNADTGRFWWKGVLVHRTRETSTIHTKVAITPLYDGTDGFSRPVAFVAHFDDITHEKRKILHDMFASLLEASKLKDNDTGRHIERVNHYSKTLAQALFHDPRWPEVDVDFIDDISFLAAMHDVGKIGVPDDILNKTGALSEFEWTVMKEHTINGAYILSSYPNPMAKQIALSHHERWDGTGYPYNLENAMIPLPARIVALADVYDALRMKRSYKQAMDHSRAVHTIHKDRGTHFDPELVDVFSKVSANFEEIFDDNRD